MIAKLANNAVFMPVSDEQRGHPSSSSLSLSPVGCLSLCSDSLFLLCVLFCVCCVQPGGVRFSLRRPSGYAKVNSSGKCVLMGGKSTMDMVTIARKIARKVQKIPEHGVRQHTRNKLHTQQGKKQRDRVLMRGGCCVLWSGRWLL